LNYISFTAFYTELYTFGIFKNKNTTLKFNLYQYTHALLYALSEIYLSTVIN